MELAAITTADLPEVGSFLRRELNARVNPEQWVEALTPPWTTVQPNHGFLIRDKGAVVGVYLVLYSEREFDGARQLFCNLAAWCVGESYRSHSVRLLRALLAQREYNFTDLSPAGQ